MTISLLSAVKADRSWNDVAFATEVLKQAEQVKAWLSTHKSEERKWEYGHRSLFLGPAGTGKTLTAAVIAKDFERPVYKIDLSKPVSKCIGETEKNPETIFDRAEGNEWILFFDEADALFGKRTGVKGYTR